MSAKHTPGPWFARNGTVWAGRGQRRHIATLNDAEYEGDVLPEVKAEDAANARLIAAAPDLLAALEEALEFVEDQEDVVDGPEGEQRPNRAMQVAQSLRAAIAKATGSVA